MKLLKHRIVQSVQFIQPLSNDKEVRFVGETMHTPHVGMCMPEMNCETLPIEKIIIKKHSITFKTKSTSITFREAKICMVYERVE